MSRTSSNTASEGQRAWQRMLSGRRLDLLDPSPLDVELDDIAHGLARVARWNGQTYGDHALSVAQHSLVVEQVLMHLRPSASAQSQLYALLHDAPEYVIGDMISPFKAVMGGAYKSVEARLQAAVHIRFGLPAEPSSELSRLIKKADRITAWFEATELAGFTVEEADRFFVRPSGLSIKDIPLHAMTTAQAQAAFASRVAEVEDRIAGGP